MSEETNMPSATELASTEPGKIHVIRRNGKTTGFDPSKIHVALTKAFLAVEGSNAAMSNRVHEEVQELTDIVVSALTKRLPGGGTIHIEDIQDQVELALMRGGYQKVARAYVLYREQQNAQRAQEEDEPADAPKIHVTKTDGTSALLSIRRLRTLLKESTAELENTDPKLIEEETLRNLFDGVPEKEVNTALVMSARTMIEKDPNYTYVTARLLMDKIRSEALKFVGAAKTERTFAQMSKDYGSYFAKYIKAGIDNEMIDPELGNFDIKQLGDAIKGDRDLNFTYLSIQTLYDRYFLHKDGTRFELPQAFFMRVAMGLAINEKDREASAIEFYELLSSFDFMSSTPTLFNSGTLRPQLSSCYLTTVPDDLDGIFSAIKDDAMLSKFAGGLGNDWTRVRGMGSHIKGTNGKSQGVVPFLKVANDTAVAVNQCFTPETSIHTASGLKQMKNVVEGDLVLGISGTYREVKKVMTYDQKDPMVKIDVKHSVEPIIVTDAHPFYAIKGIPIEQSCDRSYAQVESGKVKPEWVESGKLEKGDFIAQVIPTELTPVEGFTADDARMYGIMLGDGHMTSNLKEFGISFHAKNDKHIDFVRGYLNKNGVNFHEATRGDNYVQIKFSSGMGVARNEKGQFCGSIGPSLKFKFEDLYRLDGEKLVKHIAPRFAHLPKDQTLALIQGLIDSDGNVSRDKEISFTSTSRYLAEGIRYQALRLGIPTSGQYREREMDHIGVRSDGSTFEMKGVVKAFDIRIPAVEEIAELVGAEPLTKRNWLTINGRVYSRVKSVEAIETVDKVVDLIVEGDESYMIHSALAHNGGKRKGAMCAYLETWHLDIEEFLDLRKNVGDDRRRTHDMNTANWIPDLFMQRVIEEGDWTLFSPSDCTDLHDLTGKAFEKAYVAYEEKAARGEIMHRKVSAVTLWRKMLGMLFETGHPWVTFKDPCNIRYTNQHAGVVHSSNLCTEITLHTNDNEIAVCNLGSVNLPQHIVDGKIDEQKLKKTITTAMRMLDNVIEYNYYAVPQARNSNLRHRPVGLGVMGFQDALYKMRIPYSSDKAVDFADEYMEMISYYAIGASSDLASSRGKYESYEGSLWSRGILPIDSVDMLREERKAEYMTMDTQARMDWNVIREKVRNQGMRNSNVMAIAPTATISNICGVSQSIEPTFENLFVKSNLSGEFTVVNQYMVNDLKALGLWDEVMVNDLKYYDGSVQEIDRIPEELKELYATAFEIEPEWLIKAGAKRQKWIDQAQSLNLYMANPSGPKLDAMYKAAWINGLKTTYYLRAASKTRVEKTTMTKLDGKLRGVSAEPVMNEAPKACSLLDPDCEACQ